MKLTKIRLVNWHIFNNNTIRLDGNVVFTGENGNGKSTLIDAIYFVLSGGDEYHFNNAANSDSARTLNTYIRCKLGIEGREFKRNEADVVGHIALQFEDKIKHETKVLGCVIELSGTKAKKYFYILNDLDVEDVTYINEENIVSDYETLKKYCGKSFETLGGQSGTQRNIRNRIEDLLQLSNGENYYTLLKKAIAFVPLGQDITTFVNAFLLKEDKIKIDDLKIVIESYREIQKTLTREKAKLTCLESFVNIASEYQQNAKKLKYLEAVTAKMFCINEEVSLGKKEKELLAIDDKIKHYEFEATRANSNIDKYKDIIREYRNNDAFKALETHEQNLKEKSTALTTLLEEKNRVENIIETEQHIASDLNFRYNFLNRIEHKDIVALNQDLQSYYKDLQEKSNEYNHIKAIKQDEYERNAHEASDLSSEISSLMQGIVKYPDKLHISEIINILEERLSDKYNKNIHVLPICECFEIIDKTWINAIEGYMSNQRFDLIVEPRYFKDALYILNEVSDKMHIYEVGLVDTTKNDDLPILENSLYTKIKINNPYVETKLKQLLGQVVCVNNLDELNNYKASMTSNCMLYKNYVAKRLNPVRYEQHYIGKESQKQRIEVLTKKRDSLRELNKEIMEILEDAQDVLSTINQSRFKKEDRIENVWIKVEALQSEIIDIENEIKSMKENDNLIGLNKQIEEFEAKLSEAFLAKRESDNKVRGLYDDRATVKADFEIIKRDLTQHKNLYELTIKSNEFDIATYQAYETAFLVHHKSPLAARDETDCLIEKNRRFEKAIKDGMNEYYSHFEKNLGTSLDDLDNYIAKYNQILKTDIVNFEQKAQEAYDNAKRSFNEKFVSTLRVKIKAAQANLRAINKILEQHPFGVDEEKYSFVWDRSGDKELGNYYRVINSDKAYNTVDLLVESMPEEDQDVIKSLFETIASDENDTLAAQRLNDCLDYRKYMRYDIKITNKNNDSYLFSKIAKEKSGGETQTPFYIVIAACFEELLKKGALDSSCLIIFDEAFNNMDESRIATLLDYYNKLKSIQFLIGVPTNRSPLLAPSMDTCIGLIKRGTSVDTIYIKGKDAQ